MSEDIVVQPEHYQCYEIEPVTFIMLNDLDFATGNSIKYLCRAGKKAYDGLSLADSALVDLAKAKRYIDMQVNKLKQQEITQDGTR